MNLMKNHLILFRLLLHNRFEIIYLMQMQYTNINIVLSFEACSNRSNVEKSVIYLRNLRVTPIAHITFSYKYELPDASAWCYII